MRFLPKLGDRLTDLHPTTLAIALNNFSAVTGGNEIHDAREGNLRWLGKTMRISNVGVVNYCYIPAVPNKVSFGVVDCGAGGPDFYVISDQYGGCELHELYNPLYNQLAFLHVFRGGGDITQYTRGAGWRAGNVKRSAVIAGRHRIVGSNLSVSVVLRGSIPPLVRSKFIHIDNAPMIPAQGFQNTPGFVPAQMSSYSTVTGEDEGDSMYS